METIATVTGEEMRCGICVYDCAPCQFLIQAQHDKIRRYLREYRKNLIKWHLLNPDNYAHMGLFVAKQAHLSNVARRWMQKAVKAGYDHATMLHIYHGAMN